MAGKGCHLLIIPSCPTVCHPDSRFFPSSLISLGTCLRFQLHLITNSFPLLPCKTATSKSLVSPTDTPARRELHHRPPRKRRSWSLDQWSPTFLAPRTSFVEDNFSTDGACGGGVVQVVMREMGSDGELQMKLRSLTTTHLLLCHPVPNRPPGAGDPCSRPSLNADPTAGHCRSTTLDSGNHSIFWETVFEDLLPSPSLWGVRGALILALPRPAHPIMLVGFNNFPFLLKEVGFSTIFPATTVELPAWWDGGRSREVGEPQIKAQPFFYPVVGTTLHTF